MEIHLVNQVVEEQVKSPRLLSLLRSGDILGVHHLWREIENFSTNALALVLSSTDYNASDYIRDYDEFLNLKRDGKI